MPIYTDRQESWGRPISASQASEQNIPEALGNARNCTGIPNRVDIDEHPEVANNRERVGDWEADTIIGINHKGAIVTMDDRKSKLRLAFPLLGKKAEPVNEAMLMLFRPCSNLKQGFCR